jgi:nitrogen fixation NifU-like protein
MDFDELYQEIILDHYKHPRNKCDLSHIPDSHLHENPTCGDSIKLEVSMQDSAIDQLSFDGNGCAISMASASMMSELLSGKTEPEVKALIDMFIKVMQGENSKEALSEWGDLICLAGVAQFPVRVKCATLAWHALQAQLAEVV